MNLLSPNTKLKNRTLWFDGNSSFNHNDVISMIGKGYDVRWVDEIDEQIKSYNRLASDSEQIKVKTECDPLNLEWKLPTEYQELDVISYVMDKHIDITSDMKDNEITDRDNRLVMELARYKSMDLFGVLRTVIYIVNTLASHEVVYGIGRGSSVSSYVLYVIGVHDVDSYAYDLDIDDFLSE